MDVTLRNVPPTKMLCINANCQTQICVTFVAVVLKILTIFFWECTIIQNILPELHMWLNSNGIIFNLSEEILFFGERNVNPYKDIIKFILKLS